MLTAYVAFYTENVSGQIVPTGRARALIHAKPSPLRWSGKAREESAERRTIASAVDEEPRYWAKCAILEGEDSDWTARNRQFNGQLSEKRVLGTAVGINPHRPQVIRNQASEIGHESLR
jgi:hypothetical protein